MLSPRVVRPQPHDGAASAGSSSSTSSRRHMVDRVSEWELGLPSPAELTPVSQPLIPPALAAAFGIGPADAPSPADAAFLHDSPTSHLTPRFDDDYDEEEEDGEEGEGETDDAAAAAVGGGRGRGGKKARMVWTPELHHRFVEAVEHLGEKGAVPKAIVRLMNVDGLTRENVASHLQKYRLYLKRSHPSAASTPPPPPATAPYFPRFGAQPPPHPQEAAVRNGYRAFVSYEKLRFD